MIKNDVKDTLAEELLISIEGLLKDTDNFKNNVEALYKKYLGFPSEFLVKLPSEELESLFVHNRIKDYSKIAALGILFIDEWGFSTKDEMAFLKLKKGYLMLADIYLNKKENTVQYYEEYLIRVLNELSEYEVEVSIKKSMVDVFLGYNKLSNVDDLIFEILKQDTGYIEKAINIYEQIMNLPIEDIEKNSMTINEIKDTLEELKLKNV
ncbi:hypothetical protein SAMN02745163_00294 [Clostridium cavendishii DSM 21758]|uniref:Tetratricopeptide repeat-containing protein n=1 Tax=Clostridium cavendishii DSM 21758 TaxID=1121302 RepID=A0A1M6B9U7_9CLOT|nr:hypothetical protein [Clostridium cavendishii]SHI45511.1 hypothetical protein SAMN02745163_00294 [Clostridium cavendishii DSM 21758]